MSDTAYLSEAQARAAILALPLFVVPGGDEGEGASTTAAAEADYGEWECAVCLDGFSPGNVARTLPCSHFFHQGCIDRWLKVDESEPPQQPFDRQPGKLRTCPLCKADPVRPTALAIAARASETASPAMEAAAVAMEMSELAPGTVRARGAAASVAPTTASAPSAPSAPSSVTATVVDTSSIREQGSPPFLVLSSTTTRS